MVDEVSSCTGRVASRRASQAIHLPRESIGAKKMLPPASSCRPEL